MSDPLQRIQFELDAIAAEHGLTYVGLQRHTHDDGRKFYSANLHAGHWCRTANADSLAEALSKAIAQLPRYYGHDRDAA